MPPRTFASYDLYAAHRCACKHLIYADETPGGSCRFCECTSHTPGGAGSVPAPPESTDAAHHSVTEADL